VNERRLTTGSYRHRVPFDRIPVRIRSSVQHVESSLSQTAASGRHRNFSHGQAIVIAPQRKTVAIGMAQSESPPSYRVQ
jgi:hypothetical protein